MICVKCVAAKSEQLAYSSLGRLFVVGCDSLNVMTPLMVLSIRMLESPVSCTIQGSIGGMALEEVCHRQARFEVSKPWDISGGPLCFIRLV